jgi:hypothetical protein
LAVDAALAALGPGDRLAGVLPGGTLGGPARHSAEGLLGVGEVVGAAVVLDGGGGLPPDSPAPGALRDRAELAAQVARLLVLGGHGGGATLPGQRADDVAVGGAEVGVGLQPASPALLVLAQPQLDVGGAVGLLASQQGRGPIGRGRLGLPAQAKHPRAVALLAVGGGELLQGLVGCGSAGAGPGQLPRPIAGGLVEQAAEPVAFGPQLGGR